MKRLAVLTSGGDAPGMNAAIRAVVRAGLASDCEVFGIERGYVGLLDDHMRPLDRASVVNIIQRGGTVLGTGRCEAFTTVDGIERACEVLAARQIDGLVVIGGDGTFRGASALLAAGGPPCVGVPGTIDNDVFGADRSIGFDTAVNTALDAIDRVRDTATSHEMLHFIEVMGRHSGWLAVGAGLAGGVEVVLCPELDDDLDDVAGQMQRSLDAGKRSILVVVAEGFGHGAAHTAQSIGLKLGLEYRVTKLGYTQRGGSPTALDRTNAGALGAAAVDALLAGKSGIMVGHRGEAIVETPFDVACSKTHEIPGALLHLLDRLG